jgi:putative efflux protein, MATE family
MPKKIFFPGETVSDNTAGDMTTGSPLKLIVAFTIPMLIGGVFQQFYNIIDMLIVGKVNGSRELAAIGATGSATFFILSMTMGVTVGYSIVIAQFFGAKKTHMVRVSLASSIYVTAGCTILLAAVALLFSRPLMEILQTPADIIDDSVLYLQICLGGGVGLLVFNGASAVLRAVGDSKTPLYFLILSSVLNVLLDLLFVVVFHYGVMGVAIATVIAQITSASLCVVYIIKRFPIFHISRRDLKPDRQNIHLVLKIGLSMGLQGFFLSIGEMVTTGVVNSFGTDVVAAFATGNRVQQFAMLLYFTIAEAFAVYAGQNLGARKFDRIREGFRKVATAIFCLSIFSAVMVFLFSGVFVRLFITRDDPHLDVIVEIAKGFLHVSCYFYPFLGLIWLYNFTMRGMGDVVVPLVSGIAELVAKIGLSLWFAVLFGYYGVWFAAPIGWVLGLIPSFIRYHLGNWQKLADRISVPESVRILATDSVRMMSGRYY